MLGDAGTRKSGVSQDPPSTPSHAAGETVHTPGVHHSAGGEDCSRSKVADGEHERPIQQNLAGAGRPKRDRRGCGGLGRFLVHGNESLVEYGADEKRSISSIPEKSA